MVGKADIVVSICKTFMLHLETIFLIFFKVSLVMMAEALLDYLYLAL